MREYTEPTTTERTSTEPTPTEPTPPERESPQDDLGRLVASFETRGGTAAAASVAAPADAADPREEDPPLRRRRDRAPVPPAAWSLGSSTTTDPAPDRSPSSDQAVAGSIHPQRQRADRHQPAPAEPEPAHQSPRDDARPPGHLGLTPTRVPSAGTTVVEKIAFGLAVVVAPLGLLASVVMATISSRRRGWVPGLVSAGIVVGSVLTVVLGASAVVADGVASDQVARRQAVAESQPMCRAIALTGLDARGGDFGWPAPGDSIGSTISGIQAYADRWAAVSALAPSGIQSGVASIVSTATEIEASVSASRTIDDAGNTSRMQAVRVQSALPAWVTTYCD